MNNNQTTEKTLAEALELFEKGKSIPEILDLFPGNRKEIEEMFGSVKMLETFKNDIKPSEEVLKSTLSKIDKEVTNEADNRYLYKQRKFLPFSALKRYWKFIPVGVTALVILLLFTQLGGRNQIPSSKVNQSLPDLASKKERIKEIKKLNAPEYKGLFYGERPVPRDVGAPG